MMEVNHHTLVNLSLSLGFQLWALCVISRNRTNANRRYKQRCDDYQQIPDTTLNQTCRIQTSARDRLKSPAKAIIGHYIELSLEILSID
jgi:hypothetical protein